MFWFKSCPKCRGDLYRNEDHYGSFISWDGMGIKNQIQTGGKVMDSPRKLLYGIGTGAIIGVAAGMLLAPKTGKEARKIVVDRAGSLRSRAAVTLRQAMKGRNAHRVETSPDYHA